MSLRVFRKMRDRFDVVEESLCRAPHFIPFNINGTFVSLVETSAFMLRSFSRTMCLTQHIENYFISILGFWLKQ